MTLISSFCKARAGGARRCQRSPRFRRGIGGIGVGLVSTYFMSIKKELSKESLLLLTYEYVFMFFAVGSLHVPSALYNEVGIYMSRSLLFWFAVRSRSTYSFGLGAGIGILQHISIVLTEGRLVWGK
jgi:hypothetical protein